jgi:sporulation protein YlmC with PRC-barrel domain
LFHNDAVRGAGFSETELKNRLMTKTFLSVTIICAACALAASSRAQSASSNPNDSSGQMQTSQSWSTKHLTATGRMNEPTVRASKLVGAQVNDISGNRAAQLQDIIVNPHSGRIDFALLSVNGTPSEGTGNLVPVPWKLLRPSAAQYNTPSSQPVFTLNIDQSKLSGAPTLSSTDLDQSQWRQRVYSYYGVTPQPSTGGTDSDQEETKGQGARILQGQNPDSPTPQQAPPPNH